MRSGARVVVLLAGLFLAFSAFVWAQTATTSLRGTVYDPKGAVVPDAALSISNPATGFSRTTKSDTQGRYQFLELPPATYDLTVDAKGFATMKQSGVVLQVATPATLNPSTQ
ncbi:MAG: carboxypeptidase-like regulatory domain-containing protein, partial [Candidatus Sulfotelmatobacter sp.]